MMIMWTLITVMIKESWNMVKKSDQVRELVRQGEYKKALSITKGFKLGITREQNDKMVRAYECMVDDRFYRSLGVNLSEAIRDGVEVLVGLYGRSEA